MKGRQEEKERGGEVRKGRKNNQGGNLPSTHHSNYSVIFNLSPTTLG